MSQTSSLFTPFSLGDLTCPNRIVMAPLTRARAGESRIPNALMAEYYTQRANAGLIITEATAISLQANGWRNTPGIYNQAQIDGWKNVTESVHKAGGRIFLQLWHTGRASHSEFQPNGELPVSASAIAIPNDRSHTAKGKRDYEVPRPLESHEIPGIVADYQKAAKAAKEAGFDGVEIHGANGYLLDQFLQSVSNKREDEYGGTIENRARFLLEVVEAVCKEWPANRVGLRLSPNGRFQGMGSEDYRETFLYAAEKLNAFPLAYLHVLDGTSYGVPDHGAPLTLADFRPVYKGTLIGNLDYTQEKATEAIDSGNADLIAFGRWFITNPDLVERFQNGWPVDTTVDMSTWYSFEAEGYTTFPRYQETLALK